MSDNSAPKLRIVNPTFLAEEEFLVPAENGFIEDEDDSDSGGSGGKTGPLVDPAIFGLTNHIFMEMIREFERKFSQGWVPVTQEPKKNQNGAGLQQGPPPHPLLMQSSQFSGVDKKLTGEANKNEKGAENYNELRPNLVPAPRPTHTAVPTMTTPVPKPGG